MLEEVYNISDRIRHCRSECRGSVFLYSAKFVSIRRSSGKEVQAMADNRELTLTDKKKLEEELAELIKQKKEVAEQIQIARGFGDLSENAEYDEAKAEEARVYGRIAELENTLRNAIIVDDSNVSTESVSVGTVVRVLDLEFDEEEEYTLVGFTEADPMKLFISQESPIGEALIGAHVDEIVEAKTPGGIVKLKVLGIRRR